MSGVARSAPPTSLRPQLVSRDSLRSVTTNVCCRPMARGRVTTHGALRDAFGRGLASTAIGRDVVAIRISSTASYTAPLPLDCTA
ncbi:jg10203 [Pararge aegeria aegeria]|uniref:Jg10203 protein n=1 Tax=Pararge aegeria aegeria TaxID=348720 RepID=A0A8S4SMV8_9NEOP|nr:jg10203 [Pararge aegeria aegeria]